MNSRLADLKVGQLVVALFVAGIVAGLTVAVIHSIHQQQQADRAVRCAYLYGTPAQQLCDQGKIDP